MISGSIANDVLPSCFGSFGKSSALLAFMTNLLFPHESVSLSPSVSSATSSPASDFTISASFFAGTAIFPSSATVPLTLDVTEISRSVADMLKIPFSALISTVDRIGIVVLPGTTPDMAFILWLSSLRGTLTFTPPPPDVERIDSIVYVLVPKWKNHNTACHAWLQEKTSQGPKNSPIRSPSLLLLLIIEIVCSRSCLSVFVETVKTTNPHIDISSRRLVERSVEIAGLSTKHSAGKPDQQV